MTKDGVQMQSVTTFYGLERFLSQEMSMREDYQPYIVRELVRSPHQKAALRALSDAYSSPRNEDKALKPPPRLRKAAGVLEKHGIVSVTSGEVRLNANLNRTEQESIAEQCWRLIREYNAACR